MKGLYFPKNTLFEAKKGRRPSCCWSSILEGCVLLKKNFVWQINNGESANLWLDSWIPRLKGLRLKGEGVRDDMKVGRVAKLISCKEWDLSSIEHLISDEEKNEILKLRLPSLIDKDRLIWMPCRNGKYVVKSGYHFIKIEYEENEKEKVKDGPSSSFRPSKKLWNRVWELEVPPKICHFIWKVLNDAITTKVALFKKKCIAYSLCLICLKEENSTEHLLFHCH